MIRGAMACAAYAYSSTLICMVGNEIRRMRLRAGMTQRQLADASGVDPMSVSRIERGALSPSARTLAAIAGAFGLRLGFVRPKSGNP